MRIIGNKSQGLYTLKPQRYEDERGFFSETYNKDELNEIGLDREFIQDNHVFSKDAYVLRGLHFQSPPFKLS